MENNLTTDAIFRPIVSLNSQSPPPQPSSKKIKSQKKNRKKVESEWSHDTTLKFIQEIEVRGSLWDAGCPNYKLPKEMLWQEVADIIGKTIAECKGKWANLRTTFNSNLEKQRKKKSGQGADEAVSITWKYFKQMLFLEANKVLRSTQSTSSLKLGSALDDFSFLENVDHGTPSPTISSKYVRGKVASNSSDTSQSQCQSSTIKQMAVEALQSMRSSVCKPKNASTALCEYMDFELNNLTTDQAAFARSKLRRAFNEIMDEVAMMPYSQQQQPRVVQFDSNEMLLVTNESADDSEEFLEDELCDDNAQAIP